MASCACWPRRGTPPPPTCGRSALGRRPHHGVEKRSLSTGARGLCASVRGELCDVWYTPVLLPKGWAWDRQTPVFGPHLPVQRLRSITPVCPPASPATPLPPLRGASRGSNHIPERTTVGLSAVCRGGHDTDPQAGRVPDHCGQLFCPQTGYNAPNSTCFGGGKAMVSHLLYYQLAVLALAWLFVLLHALSPSQAYPPCPCQRSPSANAPARPNRLRASRTGLPVLCVSERPCIPTPLLRCRPIPCPQRTAALGRWTPRGIFVPTPIVTIEVGGD